MTIHVKLFAVLRELAGRAELPLDLPAGATVGEAADRLVAALPALQGHVGRAAFAVNRAYVKAGTILAEGDELALIPPVSGG